MTYAETVEAIRDAFVNDDFDKLERIKDINPIWYHDVIKEFVLVRLDNALSAFKN